MKTGRSKMSRGPSYHGETATVRKLRLSIERAKRKRYYEAKREHPTGVAKRSHLAAVDDLPEWAKHDIAVEEHGCDVSGCFRCDPPNYSVPEVES
jgi:hypothetical protein